MCLQIEGSLAHWGVHNLCRAELLLAVLLDRLAKGLPVAMLLRFGAN